MKIDVLSPHYSQYKVLHHFTFKVFEALERMGMQARLLEGDGWMDLLFDDPPELTIGFNGAPRNESGIFLCDMLQVPHISLLVDPPYHFPELRTSPYIFVTCDDRFCQEAFNTPLHPHYFFMPHGVEPEIEANEEGERPYEVVFFGSFINCDQRRRAWKTMYPKAVCELMDLTIEAVFADEKTHFILAFNTLINEAQKKGAIDVRTLNFIPIFQQIEMYLKGKERVNLIGAIQDVPVHIFGSDSQGYGWKNMQAKQPNIVIHPPVLYQEALALMQKSMLVLNCSVKNKEGAHERIFAGLSCGACVLTSDNLFMRAHFKDKESVLLYKTWQLEKVNAQVNEIIGNEAKRREIASNGRDLVKRFHTWDCRLKQLFKEIDPFLRCFRP